MDEEFLMTFIVFIDKLTVQRTEVDYKQGKQGH